MEKSNILNKLFILISNMNEISNRERSLSIPILQSLIKLENLKNYDLKNKDFFNMDNILKINENVDLKINNILKRYKEKDEISLDLELLKHCHNMILKLNNQNEYRNCKNIKKGNELKIRDLSLVVFKDSLIFKKEKTVFFFHNNFIIAKYLDIDEYILILKDSRLEKLEKQVNIEVLSKCFEHSSKALEKLDLTTFYNFYTDSGEKYNESGIEAKTETEHKVKILEILYGE